MQKFTLFFSLLLSTSAFANPGGIVCSLKKSPSYFVVVPSLHRAYTIAAQEGMKDYEYKISGTSIANFIEENLYSTRYTLNSGEAFFDVTTSSPEEVRGEGIYRVNVGGLFEIRYEYQCEKVESLSDLVMEKIGHLR